MGCCHSSIEREEMVSRCKARKRSMKQFVLARHAFSAAHVMYIRSLRTTGSALLQFANAETTVHHHHNLHLQHLLPPEPEPIRPLPPQRTPVVMPPPLPPKSPSSDTWTSMTASPALPPPPSMLSGFSKETPSSDLAMVVSRNTKDLVEIIKELDDYFLKAAEAGGHVSMLLEVPTTQSKESSNYGRALTPSLWARGLNPTKPNGFGKFSQEISVSNFVAKDVGDGGSHCSTVESLYAWEKRLYQEVKNAETIKIEHEKKAAVLRKLEMKRADYVKTWKTKKEVEKLESQMMVASQAIESTSAEIIKLRETELVPTTS